MRVMTAAALLLASSGCALLGMGGPPSPVGRYTIATEANGQPLAVDLVIEKREDGGYTGTVVTGLLPTLVIDDVTWREEDMTWIILAQTPDAPVEMYMVLDGDNVTGTWAYGMDMGEFTGVRESRGND